MPDGSEDRLMSPYVAREVGLVETKPMARRVEVRISGFHLSDGHRDCCSFHCVFKAVRVNVGFDGV